MLSLDTMPPSALATFNAPVELHGESTVNGSTGPFLLRFDRTGNFLVEHRAELGTTEARQGDGGWRVDWTGMPGPLDLSNRERAELSTWILTGTWPANPDLLRVVGDIVPDGESRSTFRVQLAEGEHDGMLTVDTDTGRPIVLRTRGLAGETELRFEGDIEFEGMHFPARITRVASGIEESVISIDSVRRGDAEGFPHATAGPRPDAPEDVRFTAASGEIPIHFAPTGHALVRARINGRDPGRFIFDTGAGQSVVSAGLLETDPALRPVGSAIGVSILGTAETPVVRGETLEFGPLALERPIFATMDLAPLESHFGEPLAGILGYDVLSRAVVEIDLAEARLAIHDPAGYKLEEGSWMPLRIQDNHPIVPAEVEGIAGLFRLDVGANVALALHGPAVREFGLLDGRETGEAQIGGEPVRAGQVAEVRLAGQVFRDVTTIFAQSDTGIFGDHHTVGNIGVEILRAFRLVLDYPGGRIAMIPKGEQE